LSGTINVKRHSDCCSTKLLESFYFAVFSMWPLQPSTPSRTLRSRGDTAKLTTAVIVNGNTADTLLPKFSEKTSGPFFARTGGGAGGRKRGTSSVPFHTVQRSGPSEESPRHIADAKCSDPSAKTVLQRHHTSPNLAGIIPSASNLTGSSSASTTSA